MFQTRGIRAQALLFVLSTARHLSAVSGRKDRQCHLPAALLTAYRSQRASERLSLASYHPPEPGRSPLPYKVDSAVTALFTANEQLSHPSSIYGQH